MEEKRYVTRSIIIYAAVLAVFFVSSTVLIMGMLFPPVPFDGSSGHQLLLFAKSASSAAGQLAFLSYIGIAFLAAMVFSLLMFLITHLTRSDSAGFRGLFFSGAFAILVYSLNILPIAGLFDGIPEAFRVRVFFSLVVLLTSGCFVSSLYFVGDMFPGFIKRQEINIVSGLLVLTFTMMVVFYGSAFFVPAIALSALAIVAFNVYLARSIIFAIRKENRFALIAGLSCIFLFFGLVCNTVYLRGFMMVNLALVFPICIIAYLVSFAIMLGMLDRENIRSMQKSDAALKAMADKEIAMLTGQIQPHFVYNTLSSIRTLIKTSPDQAYDMVYDFSKYLRSSIDAMGEARLINFAQEVENISAYLNVERVRFARRLNVEWDVRTTDFNLPPLSIQPLVENAVKHGVCKKAEGGTVTIRSYEDSANYFVEVLDDGVGFDPQVVMSANTASGSVGLKNVRLRLDITLMAILWIESVPGKGTSAVVRFPKESQKPSEVSYEDNPGR